MRSEPRCRRRHDLATRPWVGRPSGLRQPAHQCDATRWFRRPHIAAIYCTWLAGTPEREAPSTPVTVRVPVPVPAPVARLLQRVNEVLELLRRRT